VDRTRRNREVARAPPEHPEHQRPELSYAESKDFTWDVIGGRAVLANLLQCAGKHEAALEESSATKAQSR